MKPVLTLVRVVLGGLFLYAAATKLGDLTGFAEEVANYQLLPAAVVPFMAALLPGIEIAAGLFLVLGLWSRAAAVIIGVMLVGFIVGLTQALLRHINLACGCFGGEDLATWWTVARDVVLLAAAALVVWRGPGRFALSAS